MCHASIVGSVSSPSPAFSDPGPGARQLARGITATWWYTVGGVVFIELMLVAAWLGIAVALDRSGVALLVVGVGGVLWAASTVLLLVDYRHRVDAGPGVGWVRLAVPTVVALIYGGAAGTLVGSWQLAAMPVVQVFVLVSWPRGIRVRVAVAATVVLVALALLDSTTPLGSEVPVWVPVLYGVMLPGMTVSSLWWWDVLVALDRARTSEARLAATQERLRVATDVHDLQGHHLQVIALQLELAERLLPTDPQAGMEQLRAARASVDDARQGTRDLATRFRSVPLGDELANARDLLVAAGLTVEARIHPDADAAPAADLGPVIRETTTNVLRHGRGGHARLILDRTADAWRYEVANDADPAAEDGAGGSGLEGVRRRIGEAGGTFEQRRDADEFVVTVTVPARAEIVR